MKKGCLKKKMKSGDLMGAVEIGTIIAFVGCFVGLAGWITSRDNKISNDAEWKGIVNTKLDGIKTGVDSTEKKIIEVVKTLDEHGVRIAVIEATVGIQKEKKE